MKYFVMALAVALLCACGFIGQQSSQPVGNGNAQGGLVAFATLAPIGTFEYKAAPAYTQLAALRYRAASLLRKSRITVAEAEDVQAQADHVRKQLDAAVKASDANQSTNADVLLASAYVDLAAATATIEGK